MNDYKQIYEELLPLVTRDTIFVFIGTDLDMRDCIAPLISTMLQKKGKLNFGVLGSLNEKITAVNIEDYIGTLSDSKKNIIGVDACLGLPENIGKIKVRKGSPINPGKGVGKQLIEVGEHSIVLTVADVETGIFGHGGCGMATIYELADKLSDVLLEISENLG